MRFIICGTIFPAEVELILPGASPASGKYLRNLGNALKHEGYEVVYLSYCAIPRAKDAFQDLDLSDDDQVYKDKTIIRSVKEYQEKVLDTLQENDVLIFYNLDYFCLGLVDKARKRGNKSLLILADHTDSYKESGSLIRWLLAKYTAKEYRKFQNVVILSEKARRYFDKNSNILVLEGGIDMNRFSHITPPVAGNVMKFMYAGTLSHVTGVDILLESISKVNASNIEFIISGKGELEEEVREASETDSRIKYLGYISDEEYYGLLNDIDVFINPRNMSLDQNRNNFPSKVLEYLATGRRVISTRFPGNERFKDYFEFYDGEADELSAMISKVLDNHENDIDLYKKNRKTAEEYDWNKQATKIVSLIR